MPFSVKTAPLHSSISSCVSILTEIMSELERHPLIRRQILAHVNFLQNDAADTLRLKDLLHSLDSLRKSGRISQGKGAEGCTAVSALIGTLDDLMEDFFDITGYRRIAEHVSREASLHGPSEGSAASAGGIYAEALPVKQRLMSLLLSRVSITSFLCNSHKNMQLVRIGLLSGRTTYDSEPERLYYESGCTSACDYDYAVRLAGNMGCLELLRDRLDFIRSVHSHTDLLLDVMDRHLKDTSPELSRTAECRRLVRDVFAYELMFRRTLS